MTATFALFASDLLNGAEPVPRLAGGFVQLDDGAMRLSGAQWAAFLGKMTEIGLDTIVVQRLELVRQDGKLEVFHRDGAADPTAVLLRYADAHALKVFVGLRQDEQWDVLRKKKESLAALLEVNRKLADQAWTRYGANKSFRGWYLPQELANYKFSPEEIGLLHGYFKALSGHCRGLQRNRKDVAISPYFNPADETWLNRPPDYRRDLGRILDGSEVTIVMLQDGVGARNIRPQEFAEKVDPYYRAVKTLASANRQFWANVEAFEQDETPTTFSRLEAQLRTARRHADVLVTFDCYHYLNPLGHSHGPEHAAAEERLYTAYKQAITPRR